MMSCSGARKRVEVDSGTEKNCANPECLKKPDYCDVCAPHLLNEKGLCSTCSEEDVWTCDECNLDFTSSRMGECKNKDCNATYCKDCSGRNLTNGYCSECQTVECCSCNGDIDRGTEVFCSNTDCKNPQGYCSECTGRLFIEGKCPDCLGQETAECSDCGHTCLSSGLAKCNNFDSCKNSYCIECRKNLLSGRCVSCRQPRRQHEAPVEQEVVVDVPDATAKRGLLSRLLNRQ